MSYETTAVDGTTNLFIFFSGDANSNRGPNPVKYPVTLRDRRMSNLVSYAREVEGDMYETANSRVSTSFTFCIHNWLKNFSVIKI